MLAQHTFLIMFVSFLAVLRVTMVDKNKAVVCCLLATSAIILSEKKKRKRKMWSKKWYLKRNISCDAHLLNELLETVVPWDDDIVVSAGKLRKMCDSLSELHTRQSSTQSDKYQVSHRYSYFSWWWAHSREKLVEKRIKHTKKNCAPSWLYLQKNSVRWASETESSHIHVSLWCRDKRSPTVSTVVGLEDSSVFSTQAFMSQVQSNTAYRTVILPVVVYGCETWSLT